MAVSNALGTTCSHVPQGTVLVTYTNAHHFHVLLFQVRCCTELTGPTPARHVTPALTPLPVTLPFFSAKWLLTRAWAACWAAR